MHLYINTVHACKPYTTKLINGTSQIIYFIK